VAPILRLDRISKNFAGLAALKDVSFEVEEGGLFGLIGPNGAGKTTLLSVIAGSQAPSSGSITFRGRDFTGARSFRAVRSGIARTHQVPKPFRSLSVLENAEVWLRLCRDSDPGEGALLLSETVTPHPSPLPMG